MWASSHILASPAVIESNDSAYTENAAEDEIWERKVVSPETLKATIDQFLLE